MTAEILQGLVRNGGIDTVGSITPVDTIAALRALTNAPDSAGNPGLDHPKIVAVDGWATKGDSWQGFLECMGNNSATSATFTGTGSIVNYIPGDNARYRNQLVVTAVTGTITTGDAVNGTGVLGGTVFTEQMSGTAGGAGTYLTNYFVNQTSAALTSSSDNGATQFVDGSSRLWIRLWDGYNFPAEWAGIFPSNADCGPLMGRVPKLSTCQFTVNGGVLQFVTYPTQAQLSNVKWRGFSSTFNCTGSLGAAFPSPNTPSPSEIAFDYTYVPSQNIQFSGNGFVPVYDITGTGLSGLEGMALVNQLGITFGIGLRLAGATSPPINNFNYPNNLFSRPSKFSVGGFAINMVFGSPGDHCFLTGAEKFTTKGGQVGIWCDNSVNSDSGENIKFTDFAIINLAGGFQIFNSQKVTFDGGSFDYCTRNGYMSNNYTVFKNIYHETRVTAGVQFPTTAELYAQDVQTRSTFDSDTSFLGLPYSVSSLIAFDGALNSGGASSFTNFNNCQYFDGRCTPVLAPSGQYGDGKRQFINFDANWKENLYGSVTGFNGFNFPPALSPGNLMNPDWNFASGGLTFYPGSTNVTNQTSVVPVTETTMATNAALLSDSASLNFVSMGVTPGQIVYMSFLDQLSGQLAGLGGAMNFYSKDGLLIQSFPVNATAQIDNFAGYYSGNFLNVNFTTAQRSGWTIQQFAFRAPAGSSYMNGNIGTALGTVTWNPNDKASNTTLSNGNLTATGGAGASGGARANANITSASIYCEFTATSGAGAIAFGNLNAPSYGGIGGNSDAFIFTPSGTLILNFATTTGLPTWTVGDNIGVAFKLVSGTCLFWYRVNGGDWLGNPSPDPATSTGGVNVSALNGHGTTPYYPMLQLQTGDAVTANFGATSYAHAAPSGYSNIAASASYYVGNIAIYGHDTNG